MQHTATQCNTLRHAATKFKTLYQTADMCYHLMSVEGRHATTHCSTLQHTATHCNTLQHSATHCNTLQHNLGYSSIVAFFRQHKHTCHTATHCNTLQHCGTATLCNTTRATFQSSHVIRRHTHACYIVTHPYLTPASESRRASVSIQGGEDSKDALVAGHFPQKSH